MRKFTIVCILALAFVSFSGAQILDPDCLNEIKSAVDICTALPVQIKDQKRDTLVKSVTDFNSLREKMKADCDSEVGLTIYHAVPAFDCNCNRLADKLDTTIKNLPATVTDDQKLQSEVTAVNFCHEIIDQVATVCMPR
jgi:hypothetical protein